MSQLQSREGTHSSLQKVGTPKLLAVALVGLLGGILLSSAYYSADDSTTILLYSEYYELWQSHAESTYGKEGWSLAESAWRSERGLLPSGRINLGTEEVYVWYHRAHNYLDKPPSIEVYLGPEGEKSLTMELDNYLPYTNELSRVPLHQGSGLYGSIELASVLGIPKRLIIKHADSQSLTYAIVESEPNSDSIIPPNQD